MYESSDTESIGLFVMVLVSVLYLVCLPSEKESLKPNTQSNERIEYFKRNCVLYTDGRKLIHSGCLAKSKDGYMYMVDYREGDDVQITQPGSSSISTISQLQSTFERFIFPYDTKHEEASQAYMQGARLR